jgi:hypothetical protein
MNDTIPLGHDAPIASEATTPRRILKSIGAVLAGALVGAALSLGTDLTLFAVKAFKPVGEQQSDSMLLLATTYRALFSIAAGYVTARLAPARPLWHALGLGLLGVTISTAGAVATWNAGPAFEPKWYPLSLIAIALPCAWAGGKLRGAPPRA